MSLKNLALFFFCCVLAVIMMWIFNVNVFQSCYLPGRTSMEILDLPWVTTLPHELYCPETIGLLMLGILFIFPLIIWGISKIFYKLFTGNTLYYSAHIMWISWLALIYYACTSLSFFKIPT